MEPNLAESIYIRSSIKYIHFVPFRQQIWPARAILVSDWLMGHVDLDKLNMFAV
jgi:hypothetical protein